MNFTREPIIETVITPREGCKLVVRNSKGNGQEDYFCDAVEVVSFGHSFFFRSMERPKSFLVPVSDYEILELKETRMVLKNVSTDRSIKIGGGREAPPRPRENIESREEPAPEPRPQQQQQDRGGMDRKRDKRRRGRRGRDRHEPQQQEMRDRPLPIDEPPMEPNEEFSGPEESMAEEQKAAAPSFISKLFPPPPTLIKDNLSRYKPAETPEEESFKENAVEKTTVEETIFEHEEQVIPTEKNSEDEDETRFED